MVLFNLSSVAVFSTLALSAVLLSGSPAVSDLRGRAAAAKYSTTCNSEYDGYAFLYFSNRDENIYMAVSNGNDALSFTELNNGQPVLISTKGDGGVRDPFILRSAEGDKSYILATDLFIGCGTTWGDASRFGSRHLEICIAIQLWQHLGSRGIFRDELGKHVVYWASGIYYDETNPDREPIEYQRMVYATTDDFVTFSEPTVWQDEPPRGRIDSTVIKEDGLYYRFTKATVDGCADVVQESSNSLAAGLEDWKRVASCIGKNTGTEEVEGPSIFRTKCRDDNGSRYILLADEFGGDGYVRIESTDLASGHWTLSGNLSYPVSPRHGTIILLTSKELEGIKEAFKSTSCCLLVNCALFVPMASNSVAFLDEIFYGSSKIPAGGASNRWHPSSSWPSHDALGSQLDPQALASYCSHRTG
ncbi:hypothetical protein ACJZ2D_000800 [Fusarium nematophilum]